MLQSKDTPTYLRHIKLLKNNNKETLTAYGLQQTQAAYNSLRPLFRGRLAKAISCFTPSPLLL